MHRVLLLLLLVAPAAAQTQPGPEVVVLVHHPYPDDADPLGVAFGRDCERACDAFVVRHGAAGPFVDGVAFPGFVADGVVHDEGLEEGYAETLALYEQAVAQRLAQQTPLALAVASRVVDDEARVTVWVESNSALGPGLRLWVALVEDPVHYRPPPALSNGVYDHPFTVRLVRDTGAAAERIDLALPLDPSWRPERMRVAAWVEQDRQALGTFQPGEVAQAVSHPLSAASLTRQESRAVLVEGYSASWCDPCLLGDAALEELAAAHGLPVGRADPPEHRYLRPPPMPAGFLALAAAAGFALFAMARMREAP